VLRSWLARATLLAYPVGRFDSSGRLATGGDIVEYDGFDRLVETVYPDGSSEQLSYDAVGNVATRTTRAGDVFSYLYDALDRLRGESVPGLPDPARTTTTFSAGWSRPATAPSRWRAATTAPAG